MLLACDPGKDHFAYSVVSDKNKLMCTGMLGFTISSFSEAGINENIKEFSKKIKDIFTKWKIDTVVAERYLVRGSNSKMGASCEFISFMLGIISDICLRNKAEIYLITPAVWKGYCYKAYGFPKKTGLPEVFGFLHLSKNLSTIPILEHQFDSAGIALYWIAKTKKEDAYTRIKKKLVYLWNSNKPVSKVHLKSYNKVVINSVKRKKEIKGVL